jgi:hypothetical protein
MKPVMKRTADTDGAAKPNIYGIPRRIADGVMRH